MTDAEPYAPHETRMLALEMAVELAKNAKYYSMTPEFVISSARKFEAYLTETPIEGFEADRAAA